MSPFTVGYSPRPPLRTAENKPSAPSAPSKSAATFDGKTREEFFGAAANRQKRSNQYAEYKKPEKKAPEAKKEAPKPAMATGKVPVTNHASPTKPKTERKPERKPERKTVAPGFLFADRAPKDDAPASTKPRPSDSYVTGPGRRSVMTGKTSEQVAEEEKRNRRKSLADRLFRTPYNPYKSRLF